MAKVIYCKDAGFDCAEVVRGQTEEEVLQKAAEHAKAVHNTQVTPEMVPQVRALIKDE
jgi:predicted small metal-binding protein